MLGPNQKESIFKMSSEQLRKVEKIKPFGHSGAQKNKKMPHFDHFPRPEEIDPYALKFFQSLKCIQILYAYVLMKIATWATLLNNP